MKERDLEKLTSAGFSILRSEPGNLRIKIRSMHSAWKTLEKNFASAKDVEVRFNELMKHPKNIEA